MFKSLKRSFQRSGSYCITGRARPPSHRTPLKPTESFPCPLMSNPIWNPTGEGEAGGLWGCWLTDDEFALLLDGQKQPRKRSAPSRRIGLFLLYAIYFSKGLEPSNLPQPLKKPEQFFGRCRWQECVLGMDVNKTLRALPLVLVSTHLPSSKVQRIA